MGIESWVQVAQNRENFEFLAKKICPQWTNSLERILQN